MPLESYHNTPPDASFSGTGSNAWVEAHNLRMEGGGFLVGRETAGTGAPESIAVGANLTLSGGTLSASGGAGGTNTFALAGDVLGTGLVPGTLTSALSTTGITAGTYGGTAGIPRFDIDAKGRMVSAASHPLQGSAPIVITTGAGTFVVSHNTSGVAAGTFGTGNDLVQLTVNALGHVTSIATAGTIGTMGRFSSYTIAGAALGTSTTGTMTVALSTTGVTAGTYGDATNVGQFTVDAGGRITLAANVNIAGAGTLAVVQGTTTVSTVNRIVFTTNATVTSTAAGIADVAVATGTGGSSTWDTIGAAAADGTTSNTTHRIVYQVAATGDSRISWRFTESAASSGGTSTSGVPNQVLLQLDTVAASTMSPLKVLSRGNFLMAASPTATQMLFANGSASVPSIAAAAQTGSGMWFNGGGVTFSANGTQALGVGSSAGIVETLGTFRLRIAPDGSASSPSIHWNSDGFSGFFQAATNAIGVGINSTENLRFIAGGFQGSKGTADAVSYAINARKSRGTVASPTVITTGDDLLTISGYGYVGATGTYVEAARITFDSTGTIANTTSGVGGIVRIEAAAVGAVGPSEIARFTRATTTGGGWITMDEADANPGTGDLASNEEFAMYRKADKLVFAYNVAGTMNYLVFTLDGATTTFTNSTTAP